MNKDINKSLKDSSSDIKEVITLLVGKAELNNVFITDKSGKVYKVIKGKLIESGIEINSNMTSKELEHDIVINYTGIKKIEDKVNNKIIFEDIAV